MNYNVLNKHSAATYCTLIADETPTRCIGFIYCWLTVLIMWIDFRKIIAVKLLSAAFSIMPECKFKLKLAELFRDNLMDDL